MRDRGEGRVRVELKVGFRVTNVPGARFSTSGESESLVARQAER
jgi:hypothetical protein